MEATVSLLSCPCARKLPWDVPADGGFLRDKAAAARYKIKWTRYIIIIVQDILAFFSFYCATVHCRCTLHSYNVNLNAVAVIGLMEGTLWL